MGRSLHLSEPQSLPCRTRWLSRELHGPVTVHKKCSLSLICIYGNTDQTKGCEVFKMVGLKQVAPISYGAWGKRKSGPTSYKAQCVHVRNLDNKLFSEICSICTSRATWKDMLGREFSGSSVLYWNVTVCESRSPALCGLALFSTHTQLYPALLGASHIRM